MTGSISIRAQRNKALARRSAYILRRQAVSVTLQILSCAHAFPAETRVAYATKIFAFAFQ